MTTDARIVAAAELEREANRLLQRMDDLLADATRMKRVARSLREEAADLAEVQKHAGQDVRIRRERRAA